MGEGMKEGRRGGYVTDYFGCYTFDDSVIRARVSQETYHALHRVVDDGEQLTIELADEIAMAMKDWAIELGATHYTHWFQPMTGTTAEKHDALISPADGGVIVDFNGKALIRGEADASSFPSGGLRATFEARGYTTWDCTSPPFVRKGSGGAATLCIPTAFCSFTGEALDEKTPLLRSMEAVSRQSVRVLKALGHDEVKRVLPTVGGEQEYFLVDKKVYRQRKDLVYTGRTLFGAAPAKGQELEDQYYASMSERVSAFMGELNEELWKLGVPAKTQHYEAAPAQYELAPVFTTANIATDHNQIIMEMMRKVADRRGFVCLLHEKPFAGVNGSGKHNNWSLITDGGKNLLKPGKNPEDNRIFQAFFAAVIAAVDRYAPALRMSAASQSNEARLGANEAPPTIISVFAGQEMCDMLDALANGDERGARSKEHMTMGVASLPILFKDQTDRNRTSPFAFTGNKFEFRMTGSSQSLGLPNTVLNTIVADMLKDMADALEQSGDADEALPRVLAKMIQDHRRILFNGDNYSKQWHEEAARRGLPILHNTVEAMEQWGNADLIGLFSRHHVFSAVEMEARREIALKGYIKHASIEVATMLKMSKQKLLPACVRYSERLANAAIAVAKAGVEAQTQRVLLMELCAGIDAFKREIDAMETLFEEAKKLQGDSSVQARFFCERVNAQMQRLRDAADYLETMVDKEYWPLPSYGEMLFRIL